MSVTMSLTMSDQIDLPTHRRRRVAAVAALALVAVVSACSSDDESGSSTLAEPTTTVISPTTSSVPESTAAPTTRAPVTVAPTTDPAPQSSAPTTVAVTTTTEPIALQELILTGEGLGSAQFGADPDGVITYVTSILGSPTDDTGWVDPFAFAACDGTIARRVDWGALSLLFTDLSPLANGRRHFIGYEYGRVGQVGDDPVGLHTPGGITLGSRVVDLLAEFPEATVNPGETDINIPDNFFVSTVFYGLLTGVTPDDYVTVLFGGYGCGE
jgi:hypothetical protein